VSALPIEPDDYLGEGDDDYEAEPATASTIDEADRHLWRIGVLRREALEIEALFDNRMATLVERKAEALAPYESRIAWHERCAEGWMRAHHAETGTKSKRLPAGTLSLRKAPDKVDAMAPPSEEADRFVRVKREWDRAAVKEATNPGPVAEDYDAPDGYVAHLAVDHDGLVVDGVVWLLATAPAFKAVTQ
jgi:phage host-nuclease inhibitor protein Gam